MVVAMFAHDPTRTCAMRLSTGPGVCCLTLVSMAYSAMCYFGSMNLTKRRRNMGAILAIAMAFILAAPCIALADKKKTTSGKDTPSESINLNYTKTQNTYIEQRTNNPKPKSGGNGGSAPKG